MLISRKRLLNLFRAESLADASFEACMEYVRNGYRLHAAAAYSLYQDDLKQCVVAAKKIMCEN